MGRFVCFCVCHTHRFLFTNMEVPLPAEGTFDVVLGESFTGADQRRELVLLKCKLRIQY
jgi:hypothetical protein